MPANPFPFFPLSPFKSLPPPSWAVPFPPCEDRCFALFFIVRLTVCVPLNPGTSSYRNRAPLLSHASGPPPEAPNTLAPFKWKKGMTFPSLQVAPSRSEVSSPLMTPPHPPTQVTLFFPCIFSNPTLSSQPFSTPPAFPALRPFLLPLLCLRGETLPPSGPCLADKLNP